MQQGGHPLMGWSGRYHKGAARDRKTLKREEAELRQRDVPYVNTAVYRRRAAGLTPEERLLEAVFGVLSEYTR